MKSLSEQFSSVPDKIMIAGSSVITLIVGGVLLAFVAWPSLGSVGEVTSQIDSEKAKLAAINNSIATLAKEDKDRLAALTAFLQQLVPEKVDNLHFATLNELVSQAAGATVNNITIAKGTATTSQPNTAVTTEPGVESSKTTPPTTAGPVTEVTSVTVAVTYSSNFDSLLNLIKFWALADQLVGIKDLNISGLSGEVLNYTINYDLPSSAKTPKATVEDQIQVTEEQKKNLEDLKARIIYTATPAADPVGKNNPFN
jgi:hypothetical protein